MPSDGGHPSLGAQHRVVQVPTGPDFPGRESEHGDGGPGDAQRSVPWIAAGGEHQAGLDEQVESQRGERVPGQAQAAALSPVPDGSQMANCGVADLE